MWEGGRVIPLWSSESQNKELCALQAGKHILTPEMFFLKPLEADQKWKLMPWKAERDS